MFTQCINTGGGRHKIVKGADGLATDEVEGSSNARRWSLVGSDNGRQASNSDDNGRRASISGDDRKEIGATVCHIHSVHISNR